MGICYGVLLFSISILMKGQKCWMYDFLTLQEWPLLSRFTVPAHFSLCLSWISRTVTVTSDVLL